jgi:biotin carboxylase
MKILLIASTTGYQVREFSDAARRMGLDLVLATDRCHVLDNPWGDDAHPVRFEDPVANLDALAARGPFDGIVAVGDQPACVAAQVAEEFGLTFSSPQAVAAAKDKYLTRERFHAAGLLVPEFHRVPFDSDPCQASRSARYPCVLKPLGLAASRGVIRANSPGEFEAAFGRIKKLLEQQHEDALQVEDFIPGHEFALEGLVTEGRLQVLALFDKPDPLDGPFFEETIYLTPSREPIDVQLAIHETTQRAVEALGLVQGPIHAEMRVNPEGVWMLEVAARPIGGLCSRVLKFEPAASLEEVILRHALGEDLRHLRLAAGAHGVMMIPIPRAGVYMGVDGLERANEVTGIEEVVITAKEGQKLLPLPEGASYLGFIFARGPSPESVELALRNSHAQLEFQLTRALPVVR